MRREDCLKNRFVRATLLGTALALGVFFSNPSLFAQEGAGPAALPGSLTGGILVNRIDSAPLTVNLVQTPISGFIPWVGMTVTNEFADSNDISNSLFFQAEVSASPGGQKLNPNYYAVALLDSGAQVDLLNYDATQNFNIAGKGIFSTASILI